TANLSTNPRLHKEIKLAEKLGYHVSYVAFRQGGWSDEKDQSLIEDLAARPFYLSALRKPYWPWFFGTLMSLVCQWLWPFFPENLWIAAVAHNKRTFHILTFLRSNKQCYDLVIGHNLGALYPAFVFSSKLKTPFAFDIEDYHPGESSAVPIKGEVERRKFLLSSILPHASYYSYASPMIGQHVGDLLHPSLFARKFLVNNSFSQGEFVPPEPPTDKLKMVWFSQNINYGRGLEWLLPMLDRFKHDIQLVLIGLLNPGFYEEHLSGRKYIQLVAPMSPSALNASLSQYDVGLALELNTTDLNRQICLTNKIWSYLQAGLYILATDTPAQQLFMSEHPSRGLVVAQNIDSIHEAIEKILSTKDQIRRELNYRYEKGKESSWEVESVKLQQTWREILHA
ncbi:MAG TPA: hypothetical protein VFW11_14330, partial [Cyclobacteriaceae bacterium]|nr:hypothetical protein [Cyclobacteriaceae bacterium]